MVTVKTMVYVISSIVEMLDEGTPIEEIIESYKVEIKLKQEALVFRLESAANLHRQISNMLD
jgi:uncharacterized protein (DUF433 family)